MKSEGEAAERAAERAAGTEGKDWREREEEETSSEDEETAVEGEGIAAEGTDAEEEGEAEDVREVKVEMKAEWKSETGKARAHEGCVR